MDDVGKAYAELQKRHKLPPFEELDRSFEIAGIEPRPGLLREVRKRMAERLDDTAAFLHAILQPEPVVRDLHECRVFSDKEKAVIFSIYRRLMVQRREASMLAFDSDEARDAAFIKACHEEWKGALPKLLDIAAKVRDSWKRETSVKEELGYLG